MLEQVYLSEQVDALITKMNEAAIISTKLAGEHENPDAREQLAKLCREKQRSSVLAERLLEILE